MSHTHYYTTGEFMKLTHVTKKTIRYYDEHNILKPTKVTENGNRLYTDEDLAQMQQILLFKYLGFSLNDIREMTINNSDSNYMAESLKLQQKLVQDRIEQLQLVSQTLQETSSAISNGESVDWSQMRELVELTGMENSLKKQYQNASNISSRINLHKLYSQNPLAWFPWLYKQVTISSNMRVLEIGCGDGSFWLQNMNQLPEDIEIVLSDISQGMLRDTRRTIRMEKKKQNANGNFSFKSFATELIPFEDNSFDIVFANHVLFYCSDISKACAEIRRVLKPGGTLICSTYGNQHMIEVSQLASGFDDRIILSANKLYDRFGKENGSSILSPYFTNVTWTQYVDELIVPEPEPLISYVLSCHGNQNQFILDRYTDFKNYVRSHLGDGFHITKDAGIFLCK